MSKYYGESERLLGKVFSLANDIPGGAIVFLDEVINANTALCVPPIHMGAYLSLIYYCFSFVFMLP